MFSLLFQKELKQDAKQVELHPLDFVILSLLLMNILIVPRFTWWKIGLKFWISFESFLNEIKNPFSQVIKILRSGYAKKYFSSGFSALLNSHGILHHSTYPHIPQQNGIAKRKIDT